MCISLLGFTQPRDLGITAAIDEPKLAIEFPFQLDMNTGDTVRFTTVLLPELFYWFSFRKQIGVGWIQATSGGGQRYSSATTYIGPDYINRTNLHILLHAHATKPLEATDLTATPRFFGVQFGTGPCSKLIGQTSCIPSFTGRKAESGR